MVRLESEGELLSTPSAGMKPPSFWAGNFPFSLSRMRKITDQWGKSRAEAGG